MYPGSGTRSNSFYKCWIRIRAILEEYGSATLVFNIVADPDADSDPAFLSVVDPNPDPTFQVAADPDPTTCFSPDLNPTMLQK